MATGSLQDEVKRTMLKEYSCQWNDAGSTIVAGLLQVRPKGATQVAPALFWAEKSGSMDQGPWTITRLLLPDMPSKHPFRSSAPSLNPQSVFYMYIILLYWLNV
ncbi:hypothetical protein C9I99_25585 [Photobacterium lutimaris]|uniref:Uncharacterized protein n=1 Tax=Photobacterium lutimaris TaxID=388278 RepID=A0A2T3IKG7_9GAMM|nr:hypothetical protein C9I99_25585 [Photobacterium lutimaris]